LPRRRSPLLAVGDEIYRREHQDNVRNCSSTRIVVRNNNTRQQHRYTGREQTRRAPLLPSRARESLATTTTTSNRAPRAAMESQNQEIVASGSPAEVPNDPGYEENGRTKGGCRRPPRERQPPFTIPSTTRERTN